MLIAFIKRWTLPLAMITGVAGYFVLAALPQLAPARPFLNQSADLLLPLLIFGQLLLTFCKVERLGELRPCRWHGLLLLFQLLSCLAVVALLLHTPLPLNGRIVLEGLMVCLICPTATAAAVITAKLGGNAATLTTYTLLSNLLAAVCVPLFFPMVEPHAGIGFAAAFLKILGKVFPLLILPFLLAWALRLYLPRVHALLMRYTGLAFYMWALALVVVTARTVNLLLNSEATPALEWAIALSGLLICAVQFFVGKRVGRRYGDLVSSGQALGQKNTILAIWMSYAYLHPLSSIAPSSYVLWQNIYNAWQLYRKERKDAAA
ncbi:MAG: bile acid:sodium symporter [Prevotellaceae bacterium]|jgi:BASS family bile acid:Na+ symporter|nr:bile acid:sodium symporter [Prevotellaceae bacterium]